jgi:hypothetical protein
MKPSSSTVKFFPIHSTVGMYASSFAWFDVWLGARPVSAFLKVDF